MQTVIIICGGQSVTQYDVSDLRARGHVVGVNESAVRVECDIGITMDRLWAEHRFHQFFTTRKGDLWVRRGADKHLPQHPRLVQFECDHTSSDMTLEPRTLNGANSGMVALNYAYTRAQRVYVFGLDMQRGDRGEPYWHPPYEWASRGATTVGKYRQWAPQFASVHAQFQARGVKLVSVNHRSLVTSIPQISYKRFIEETT